MMNEFKKVFRNALVISIIASLLIGLITFNIFNTFSFIIGSLTNVLLFVHLIKSTESYDVTTSVKKATVINYYKRLVVYAVVSLIVVRVVQLNIIYTLMGFFVIKLSLLIYMRKSR